MIPYMHRASESMMNICKKHGIHTHFKHEGKIKKMPVEAKNKDTITQKNDIIYNFKCKKIECGHENIEST